MRRSNSTPERGHVHIASIGLPRSPSLLAQGREPGSLPGVTRLQPVGRLLRQSSAGSSTSPPAATFGVRPPATASSLPPASPGLRVEPRYRVRWPTASDRLPRPGSSVKVVTPKDMLIENSRSRRAILGSSMFHSKYDPKGVLYFRDIFREMDTDGDGRVDAREFCEAMVRKGMAIRETFDHDAPAVKSKDWDAIFRNLDEDANDGISFEELLHLVFPYATQREFEEMLKLAAPPPPRPPVSRDLVDTELTEINDLFDLYDEDGDGRLTLDEFRAATAFMTHISREDCKRMMDSMDLNGDNVVSREEFIEGMRKLYTDPS